MRLKTYLIILFIGTLNLNSHAQQTLNQSKFETGKPAPDFRINNVDYFDKKQVSSADFRGKWLILDFWTASCASCIQSFPKINQLQKQFKDQIQFFLVGNNSTKHNKGITTLFNKIRTYQQLELPIGYDSLMFERFEINATPCLVAIDPKGIVRKIGASGVFTEAFIRDLISGSLAVQPLTTDTDTLLGSSTLSKWTKGSPMKPSYKMEREIHNSGYSMAGVPLQQLYNLAYIGQSTWNVQDSLYALFWKQPLLEIQDSSLFNFNNHTGRGFYNYEIKIQSERANKSEVQFAMQCDLYKHFKYKVSIEKRWMPCWNITITKAARIKLRTKSTKTSTQGDFSGVKYKNVPISILISGIANSKGCQYPVFDRTEMLQNIDLEINTDRTNFQSVKQALKLQGIELILAKTEFKVIVLKDDKR